MSLNIEVCVKDGTSNTERGRLLEKLAAKTLEIQQYEVVDTIRVTGMEIDVLARHKINNTQVLVECKAWDSNLPADVISKLLGNVFLRNASAGWLITTGSLSKDAEGIRSEWETKTDEGRSKLSFYTPERIIKLLYDSGVITNVESLKVKVADVFSTSENSTLIITDMGNYWLVPIVENNSDFITSIVVFNATTGERIIDDNLLNELKLRKNSYSDFLWLAGAKTDNNAVELLIDEYNSIVPILCSDDWADYRPARPEDFVGRNSLLNNIFSLFNSIIEGSSATRIFSVKATSGMGKSSVLLKICSMAKSQRKSKKYFIHAVDVRTAISARYAEMALKSCFDSADASGFTDVKERNLEFTNIVQFLQSDSVIKTLQYLKQEKKLIVLIFDQFEELFSKKELFGLFDNIRILCNILDAQKQNFIVGFAWKTDLSIPAEHPAYFMWSNLSDRRREFDVHQFKTSEIKSAIRIFGVQLGEKINPVLGSYLAKQCQGYPWLLKKLCIHVFNLINEGTTQDAVIGKKLNIVDLFERDLSELTPVEHSCIIEIAKDTPADYFKIADAYGNDVIQSLVNRRIVIRRASRLTLYWDIFRDYVINKTIPSIVLDYIPQQQFASIAKMLSELIDNGPLSTSDLSKNIGVNINTIDNLMIDCVMFGVAKRENDMISVTTNSEEELIDILQSFFKAHILYIQLLPQSKEGFDYTYFQRLFNSIYEQSDVSVKTKRTYCAKMYNWFIRLGLVYEKDRKCFVKTTKASDITLKFNIHHIDEALFWGQTSPEKMITAYNLVTSGMVRYTDLRTMGYKNAIEALSSIRGITKEGDIIVISKSIAEIFNSIKNSSTITLATNELQKNLQIKGVELGEILNNEFSRKWSRASKIRYGSAVLLWCKYIITQ